MKFRYEGMANILHLNTRKEGPEDEGKVLAVDMKLEARMPAEQILGRFFPELQDAIYTDIGAVRNPMLAPLAFQHELRDYRITSDLITLTGCSLKKFVVTPVDVREARVVFQASFKPSSNEVARLAEYLADEVNVCIEPIDGELDLDDEHDGDESDAARAVAVDGESDPLYDQAVAVVLEHQRASISLVQRCLRIGYNRAARLIEQMERSHFVSPMKPDGSRDVLANAPNLRD